MKIFLKIVILLLLLFNGVGALFGGWQLMAHPDGSSIELSMHWLEHTIFNDYFIPGLILFIANGIFSLLILFGMLFNLRIYPWLVIAQGAILCGWLFIQVLLIQTIYYLHYVLIAVGLMLIVSGWLIKNYNRQ